MDMKLLRLLKDFFASWLLWFFIVLLTASLTISGGILGGHIINKHYTNKSFSDFLNENISLGVIDKVFKTNFGLQNYAVSGFLLLVIFVFTIIVSILLLFMMQLKFKKSNSNNGGR